MGNSHSYGKSPFLMEKSTCDISIPPSEVCRSPSATWQLSSSSHVVDDVRKLTAEREDHGETYAMLGVRHVQNSVFVGIDYFFPIFRLLLFCFQKMQNSEAVHGFLGIYKRYNSRPTIQDWHDFLQFFTTIQSDFTLSFWSFKLLLDFLRKSQKPPPSQGTISLKHLRMRWEKPCGTSHESSFFVVSAAN